MKKIAIVTGASSGIGKLLATGLPAHAQFDELWAIARSEARLNALQEEMPIPVRPIPLDLTKAESIERVKSLLAEEKPVISVLINASGYGVFERFDRIPEQDAAGMTDLNCRALALMMLAALPYCEKGSIIVNVASVAAFQPVPFGAEYAATKAYVLALSRAVNREMKPRGVRVLSVCPYWTKTAFFDRANGNSVITHFDCMYDPAFIAKKTFRAMKKKKDYVVPGFIAKATHALTKLLPHSFVMKVFIAQQKLGSRNFASKGS